MNEPTRHILCMSGGKDSTALALYMRDRVAEMEYVFCDTDKELTETYEYLNRVEAFLGKKIVRLNAKTGFDHWLEVFGGYLPSPNMRWCTKMLKLKPFEEYVGTKPVVSYVGLRADEDRVGYISTKPNIRAVFPFKEDGIDYAGVMKILEDSGIGLPPYLAWGRTHSKCHFKNSGSQKTSLQSSSDLQNMKSGCEKIVQIENSSRYSQTWKTMTMNPGLA